MEILRSEDGLPSATPSGLLGPTAPEAQRFAIVGPRRIWVSPAIIALNATVFVVMIASGASFMTPTTEDLLKFGADHGPNIASGEWWRLLTNAFVHIGILHIGLNMWVFRSLGAAVERLYGNAAFALLYVASALGGSIASMLWNPAAISAGASGAIFGVAGAFLAFFLGHRQAMPVALFRSMTKSLVSFVAINVMFGLVVPGIDNAAHIGGLFTGFVAGYVLNRVVSLAPDLDLRRAMRAVLLFAALLAVAALIPWRVRTDAVTGPAYYSAIAWRALDHNDFDEAVRAADEWIARTPADARAWEMRGVGRFELADEPGSRADLDRALGLDPSLTSALSRRAYLRMMEDDVEGALRDYDAYIVQLPASAFGFRMRANARYAHRDWLGAMRDFQYVIGLDPADSSEARLYVWVLRARLSMREEATAELRQALDEAITVQWNPVAKPIASYLVGDLDDDQLAAALPDSARSTADFFRGMKRLLDGDREGAIALLIHSIESADGHSFETIHAREELAVLAK